MAGDRDYNGKDKIVDNPFARKYLLSGGKLVESQVYVSYNVPQQTGH